MNRGRTARGRSRAGFTTAAPKAKPLLRTVDEGDPVRIDGRLIGAQGDRWIDPFIAANDHALARLGLTPEVHSSGGLHLELRPSGRIGAVPLVAPATGARRGGAPGEPEVPVDRSRWRDALQSGSRLLRRLAAGPWSPALLAKFLMADRRPGAAPDRRASRASPFVVHQSPRGTSLAPRKGRLGSVGPQSGSGRSVDVPAVRVLGSCR